MRIRKAMAVALAGALALTTIATGTTINTPLHPRRKRLPKYPKKV